MSFRKLEHTAATLDDRLSEPVTMPEPSAAGFIDGELAKFEIADRLRTAALSPLDLQSKLAADVFMSDEERAEFERITGARPPPAAPNLAQQQQTLMDVAGNQLAPSPASVSGASISYDLGRAEAPLPPRGPFGDLLGFEGALAPELGPQGLLASLGLCGPQGLMAPRSLAGNLAHAAHAEQKTGGHEPSLVSHDEIQRHFQPSSASSSFPSLWQKHGPSPIEEIISRLINLIKTLLGLGPPGGYRGGKPELGRG